jgi:hypothetical protein
MDLFSDYRVVVRNARGQYLAEDSTRRFFTDDRSQAMVFNFRTDNVQEQLEAILKEQGVLLTADPVPPEEIYETCDRCKELFMPYMTFFDGKQFLCADCRAARCGVQAAAMTKG